MKAFEKISGRRVSSSARKLNMMRPAYIAAEPRLLSPDPRYRLTRAPIPVATPVPIAREMDITGWVMEIAAKSKLDHRDMKMLSKALYRA